MSKDKTNMPATSSAQIRESFLSYFEDQGHSRIDSSSLVPGNDPTLLFTNAGMVPFKDVFLGDDSRGYVRATSSQRCVRAGGKHNDLENVGYTARHHTFFEMLGNFSFGDYFKSQAIPFSWEFLTEVLGIPEQRLWVTVYADDDDAYTIWRELIGLPAERIIRIGDNKGARYASDNFWSMGETGPCGPCTEIFYDHGEGIAGGLPGTLEEDGDRYIEIWNIVFMQFNREVDGTMTPLPKPSVDTGMGLERIAAVMQGVHSNFEIDLFKTLLVAVAKVLGVEDRGQGSLRVIVDHIRSCAFLITDGVFPSNEGRGYVLRRIIRRAVRHGHKLGASEPFFWRLVEPLSEEMGQAYPELHRLRDKIEAALRGEEEQFAITLEQGMKVLEQDIASLDSAVIPGETAFKLYDTYGFPLDLTADIARERSMEVDVAGYNEAMERQRSTAKAASQFKAGVVRKLDIATTGAVLATHFVGYEQIEAAVTVQAIFFDGQSVSTVQEGGQSILVLDQTPFYAESGGQVGDCGRLESAGVTFVVEDTQKQGDTHLHQGLVLSGELSVGDQLTAEVSSSRRRDTALNHSATHLLHAVLRQVVGGHVEQKGSLVDDQRLRFDFAHSEALTAQQCSDVSDQVNQQIRANTPISTVLTDMESAEEAGAMALFGEKYGDQVRLLKMGEEDFSVELCGGTHADRTGDIGLFRIVSESGIASGVRRIEALTGAAALAQVEGSEALIRSAAGLLKAQPGDFLGKLEQLLGKQKVLEKQLHKLQQSMASNAGKDLANQAERHGGVSVLVSHMATADVKALRGTVDQLKQQFGDAVIVLAAGEKKISLVAGVSDKLTAKLAAGDIIRQLAAALGGKGGGRADFAQGGGVDQAGLKAALEKTKADILSRLA